MSRCIWVPCACLFALGCTVEIPEEPQSEAGITFEPTSSAPAEVADDPVQENFASVNDALSSLVDASASDNKKQQMAAYTWLCQQGPAAIDPVVATMNDESVSITARRHACRVLGHLGPEAAAPLIKASQSDNLALKLRAIETLPAIEPMQASVVQRLIQLLDHSNDQIKHTAIRSLGHIGPPAKASADKLNALRDNVELSETTRMEAGKSLKLIRPIRSFED